MAQLVRHHEVAFFCGQGSPLSAANNSMLPADVDKGDLGLKPDRFSISTAGMPIGDTFRTLHLGVEDMIDVVNAIGPCIVKCHFTTGRRASMLRVVMVKPSGPNQLARRSADIRIKHHLARALDQPRDDGPRSQARCVPRFVQRRPTHWAAPV